MLTGFGSAILIMIFIPCWKGISHNQAERAKPEDIAAASQLIADMLIDLANES